MRQPRHCGRRSPNFTSGSLRCTGAHLPPPNMEDFDREPFDVLMQIFKPPGMITTCTCKKPTFGGMVKPANQNGFSDEKVPKLIIAPVCRLLDVANPIASLHAIGRTTSRRLL